MKLTVRHTVFHAMAVIWNQQGLPHLKTKYLLEVADEQKRNNSPTTLFNRFTYRKGTAKLTDFLVQGRFLIHEIAKLNIGTFKSRCESIEQ